MISEYIVFTILEVKGSSEETPPAPSRRHFAGHPEFCPYVRPRSYVQSETLFFPLPVFSVLQLGRFGGPFHHLENFLLILMTLF